MKYCQKCGKELKDEAVVCVGCGCNVSSASSSKEASTSTNENPTLAILSLVFAFIIPLVGFIFGIVGMNKYYDPTLRERAKKGMLLSLAAAIIYFTVGYLIGYSL